MVIVIILFHVISGREKERPSYIQVERSCAVSGIVSDISTVNHNGDRVVTLKSIDIERGTPLSEEERILVMMDSFNEQENHGIYSLGIGNSVLVKGTAYPFSIAGNPGQFDEYSYYRNAGYAYRIRSENILIVDHHYSFREYLRRFKEKSIRKIYEYLPENDAGIASAMLFGEKKLISEDDRELYKQNGIMHILAVSGLHVSMISMILLWIISLFPINYYAGRISVIIILFIYGILTGFSVSCIRALIMILIQIIARLKGKNYDALSAVSAAGIINLLIDSRVLFSCGFLLSYGAVFGIIWSDIYIKPLIKCPEYLEGIRDTFVVALGVTLYISPVILYYYYEIPIYSVFINMLIVPSVSLLFILIVLYVISMYTVSVLTDIFAGGIHALFYLYDRILNLAGKYLSSYRLTGHIGIEKCVIYYCMIIVFTFFLIIARHNIKKLLVLLSLCVISLMTLRFDYDDRLMVTVLDVGQGDGIFIHTPEGRNIMVDGGSSDVKEPGKYRIEPFLKYNGVTHIDYWIITHMDEDHYSGLLEVIEREKYNNIYIKNLVLSDAVICREKSEDILIKKYHDRFNVFYIKQGDEIRSDDVNMICLNPVPGKEYNEQNDASVVLDVQYGEFDMLLTGDIESEAEEDIVFDNSKDYEILKAPHHGSSTSSSDYLLNNIDSSDVIISYGKNNRYGHPSKDVMIKYKKLNMKTYETAKNGAVTVYTDGKRYNINTFLK